MLICPNCSFKNPDNNNFCQQCGISLTHTVCQKCGVDLPLQDLECSVCGNSNKILLWGIVVSQNQETDSVSIGAKLAKANVAVHQGTTTTPENSATNKSSSYISQPQNFSDSLLETNQQHLDSQKRYAIEKINFHQPSSIHSEWHLVQVQVADKNPLQASFLEKLQRQQPELFAELGETLDKSYLSMAEYWNMVGVPTFAVPYLLVNNYHPIIPQLYDAWQENQQGIVLLEDRSQWQLLSQIWSEQDLDLLQLLWSLDEIAKLWIPLSKIGCANSLLVETNLLVDEDQSFCLQQLYMDHSERPPTLGDLASKLKLWLSHSPQNYYEQLSSILEDMIAGKIESVAQFRSKMQELVRSKASEATDSKQDNQEPLFNDFVAAEELSNFDLLATESDQKDENLIYDSFIDYSDCDSDEQPTALLPMELEKIDHASCTHIGSQRDHNEDFFGIKTSVTIQEDSNSKTLEVRNIYMVCDGMGGHAAGEVASAMAVETLTNYFQTHWQNDFPTEATIRDGILLANQTLCGINSNNSRSGSGRMGTTLVLALIQNTQLAIAHVGDSRIYRITKRQGLEQLTLDHEVGQREINRGVEPKIAYGRPDAYQLTQALGPRESKYLKPSIDFFKLEEDCLLLLCSDGLSDNQFLEKYGESHLKSLISSSADLKSGLSELIDLANNYNGHDNLTAVAIRIKLKPRC